MPRTPIETMIDRVDLRCTKCGASISVGCQCWKNDSEREGQAICAVADAAKAWAERTRKSRYSFNVEEIALLKAVGELIKLGW